MRRDATKRRTNGPIIAIISKGGFKNGDSRDTGIKSWKHDGSNINISLAEIIMSRGFIELGIHIDRKKKLIRRLSTGTCICSCMLVLSLASAGKERR